MEDERDGGCQTVRINSAAPLSSTDGVASIFCLFCQNNVLWVGVGGGGWGLGACPPVPSHTSLQVCGGAQLLVPPQQAGLQLQAFRPTLERRRSVTGR